MELIYLINNFFNVKPQSGIDKGLALINSKLYFKKNANAIVNSYQSLKVSKSDSAPKTFKVEKYSGGNPQVKELAIFLDKNIQKYISGAYVHGSIGTNEVIAYSDFDALIILKDEAFESEKVLIEIAEKLFESTKYFYQFDPLQHHRWFMLTEKILQEYPETFFPVELLPYCKSLFEEGTELEIYFSNKNDFIKPFQQLSLGIIKTVEKEIFPESMYQLKSLLSEFMLLPAFYLQTKNKKGIFKKHSFELARKDFSNDEWKIMDDVSHIRLIWHYEMNDSERKKHTAFDYRSREQIKRKSISIPDDIASLLNKDFYHRMMKLARKMQEKISASN